LYYRVTEEYPTVRAAREALAHGRVDFNSLTELDYSRVDSPASRVRLLNDCQDMTIAGVRLPEFLEYRGISMWPLIADGVGLFGPFAWMIPIIDWAVLLAADSSPDVILFNKYNNSQLESVFVSLRAILPIELYSDPWMSFPSCGWKAKLRRAIGRFPNLKRRLEGARILWRKLGHFIKAARRNKAHEIARGVSGQGKDLPPAVISPPAGDKSRVLFASWEMEFRFDAENRLYDTFFSAIHDAMCSTGPYDVCCVELPDGIDRGTVARTPPEKLPYPIFRLDAASPDGLDELVWEQTLEFHARMRQMESDREFERQFSYKGISLLPILKDVWRSLLTSAIPLCIANMEQSSKMLDRVRPDLVMATFETGSVARGLIIEAKRRGIPTIGLQHGVVGEYYLHKNQTIDLETDPYGFIAPDVTCLYSEASRTTAGEQGHYPPGALVVTGDWRQDRLYWLMQRFDRAEWCRKYSLDPGKRIVTLLTGLLTDQLLPILLPPLVDQRQEWETVVKIHPREKLPQVSALCTTLGFPDLQVLQCDVYEAILAADLLICTSPYSAVLFDIVCVRKPFIVFNPLTSQAPDYLKIGRVVHKVATTQSEYQHLLSKYLSGQPVNHLENYDAFIDEYAYRFDGEGASRVARVVTEVLSKWKKNG